MPEGDTIHRSARTLQRAIGGREVLGFESPLPALADADLVGRTIEAVEARGKHLLVRFDDGRALDTHMRMEGSWHVYRPGEAWQAPASAARMILRTAEWIAICFGAPWVRLVDPEHDLRLARLGPDLLDPSVDLAEAGTRIRARPDLAIGEAVMHQGLVAGIGNVYKSETLFLCRQDPFERVSSIGEPALQHILQTATTLMRANLSGGARVTRRALRGSKVWVYGRRSEPCFECAAPIAMRRQGEQRRSTYFCPRCQRVT